MRTFTIAILSFLYVAVNTNIFSATVPGKNSVPGVSIIFFWETRVAGVLIYDTSNVLD